MNLLLHPNSQKLYNTYKNHIPQSLLLIGPMGSGKKSILINLAQEILNKDVVSGLIIVEPKEDKNTVGIEQIRELKSTTSLKSAYKKIIIIPDAENLTLEAQNSLLKLLEEPPENTHIFLSVNNLNEIISTIISRVILWHLNLPSKAQIIGYYDKKYPEPKLNKAIMLGDGRMGLIDSILNSEEDHLLIQAVDTVKEILSESVNDRLIRVDAIIKDLIWLRTLLDAMSLACKAALEQAIISNLSKQKIKAWLTRLQLIEQAQADINLNVSAKLVLDKLFLML